MVSSNLFGWLRHTLCTKQSSHDVWPLEAHPSDPNIEARLTRVTRQIKSQPIGWRGWTYGIYLSLCRRNSFLLCCVSVNSIDFPWWVALGKNANVNDTKVPTSNIRFACWIVKARKTSSTGKMININAIDRIKICLGNFKSSSSLRFVMKAYVIKIATNNIKSKITVRKNKSESSKNFETCAHLKIASTRQK